ncbi:MAG: cysteine desulfurase family protein [Patescibacteria group bacterium]
MFRNRLYFDYAAGTPVAPSVMRAMRPYFSGAFGNPGSLHSYGQEALAALDLARERVASALGAQFREIIFTGSATEANNIALRGALGKFTAERGRAIIPRIIVSAIEHESVLETAKELKRDGADVVILPVSQNGVLDPLTLKEFLNDRTALVSIQYANNEVGVVQPIAEIAERINEQRGDRSPFPLFHTDAAQAFQFLNCTAGSLRVDLMTLSAHKFYGPKGVGALYVRGEASRSGFPSFITGGGQEFMLRSGTENVPLIVGFGEAVRLVLRNRESESKRIGELAEYFKKKLAVIAQDVRFNASEGNTPKIPNIISVYFPGRSVSSDLLLKFDLRGLAVSAGSACRARSAEPSYVLQALGYPRERVERSVRFSLGRPTTKSQIDKALRIIKMSL